MSVLLLLLCDAAADGLCGQRLQSAHADPAALRRRAAGHGWTFVGDEARCPRHNPDPPPRSRIRLFDSD